jgi:hypothetical protein
MSYYNTQNNPQQNPQVQANSPYNQQIRNAANGGQRQAGQSSFNNWMKPQRQARQPQQKTQNSEQMTITPSQQQNPQGGWQPRSPVNPNGTISPNPMNFSAAYQPPTAPTMAVKRTQSTSGGTSPDPQWATLRAQQTANPANVPQQYQGIAQAYQQNLGRPGSVPEWQNWANNPNFATAIANSPEAQAWKQQQMNPQSQTPNPFANLPQYNPMAVPEFMNMDFNSINTPNMYDVNRPEAYNYGGQLAEGLNPFSQGTQQAFQQLQNMPLGLPVDQMKAAQAETANEMFQQNASQGMQRAAASGTVNGGMAERQRQQMMADRNQQILSGYRDIDIEDAYAQRDNAGRVAELGNTLADSYSGRLVSDEDARYRDAESNRIADTDFQDFLSQQYGDAMDASNFELDKMNSASEHGQGVWDTLNDNYKTGRAQNLQDFLGTEGMNLDWANFDETQGQNKFGNIMDLLGFMEDQRQFDSTFGLDNKKFGLDKKNSALANALKRRDQDINLLSFFGEG